MAEENPFFKIVHLIDDKVSSFFKKKWAPFVIWPAFIAILYALFFIFSYKQGTYDDDIGFRSQGAMKTFFVLEAIFAIFVIAYMVIWGIAKRLTRERVALSFFLLASLIVMGFGLCRIYNDNAYTHDFSVYSEGGHWAVIYDIYKTGKIPPADLTNQYYQPKLYHALIAFFMRFNSLLWPHFSGSEAVLEVAARKEHFAEFSLFDYTVFESGRIFLIAQGIITLYFIYRVICDFPLKNKASNIASFIIFFTPVMWFITYYKNNDSLAFLFMMAALHSAYTHYKKRDFVSIILTAICIGLGMEAKLSAAVVAFPVAFIFLIELLGMYRKGNIAPKEVQLKFYLQIGLFALIVFPLGLGGAILMKVKYGIPIGYVWDLIGQYGTGYFMYIDPNIYSTFNRVALFPSPDLFWDVFNVRYHFVYEGRIRHVDNSWGNIDFNIWTAFIKTGLWSEAKLTTHEPFSVIIAKNPGFKNIFTVIYALAIGIGFLFLIGSIYFIVKRIIFLIMKKERSDPFFFYLIPVIFVSAALAYALFSIKYPVGCTMNARYAMILYIPIGVVAGAFINEMWELIKKLFAKKKRPE